jgi:hypothetical protein
MIMRKRLITRLQREKGSALLVSLMIMVGLSLLGLGFVAISETESSIAVNERNYVQAQSAAETGTKAVVEMFQDATWAFNEGVLPKNLTSFKTDRCHDGTCTSHDSYKSNASDLLFNFPFKGANQNKFYGDIDSADVIIKDDAGGPGTQYLDAVSKKLFYQPAGAIEKLRLSEVRVYAPPWPNAQKVYGALTPTSTNGWFASDNARYGVATVRVTAQKLVNGAVRAERSVKAIIAETPFPTVDGAIETSGSLVGQGNFNVYWGKILSEQAMQVNRPAVGLPWFDARNFAWFEYGYDSTTMRKDATSYIQGSLVHAPDSCIAGDSDLGKFAFRNKGAVGVSAVTASAPSCATWVAAKALASTLNDGTVTWTAEESRPYRFDSTITDPTLQFYEQNAWLYQVLGKSFEDPWLHARARNTLVYNNSKIVPCGDAVSPHPCDYTAVSQDVTTRYSNFFQNQYTTDAGSFPERVEAVFPTMDYEFWKAIAQSSSNQPGTSIYYFQFSGSPTPNSFTGPNGVQKDVIDWLNAAPDGNNKPYNGLGAGFYFFDTQNGKNPQFNKGGILTPTIAINAGSIKDPNFQIRGYVYLNATYFGSTGLGNKSVTDVYPMPPEPYRDIGYREVDVTGPNKGNFRVVGGNLPTGTYSIAGANNGQWDYEDVNGNGQFDVFVADITKGGAVVLTRPDGTTLPTPTWAPVPYVDGCTPPDPTQSPAVTGNCSEPHEPYLNLTYPPVGTGSPTGALTAEWYDPTAASAVNYRRPKTRTGVNTTVICTATSSNTDCTSNAYDSTGVEAKGAVVTLSAIAWGAIYNEGGYAGSGNADYYGALLMRGSFSATGTPNVWFDACLAAGCLETQLKMQRVMVTSMQTD